MRPCIRLLQSLGKVYATDYWDFSTLRPTPVNDTMDAIATHMSTERITRTVMRPVLERVLSLFEYHCHSQVTEVLYKCATKVKDSPRVGEWWGARCGSHSGKVVSVVSTDKGIGPDFCECTQGDKITLQLIPALGVCGDLTQLLRDRHNHM